MFIDYNDWLETEQQNDLETKHLIDSIKNGTIDKNLDSSYEIPNNLLYRIYSTKDNKTKIRLLNSVVPRLPQALGLGENPRKGTRTVLVTKHV